MRDRSQDLLYALLLAGGAALMGAAVLFGPAFVIVLGGVCAIALGAVGVARLADMLVGDNEERR